LQTSMDPLIRYPRISGPLACVRPHLRVIPKVCRSRPHTDVFRECDLDSATRWIHRKLHTILGERGGGRCASGCMGVSSWEGCNSSKQHSALGTM
jgi:hypothetical protein